MNQDIYKRSISELRASIASNYKCIGSDTDIGDINSRQVIGNMRTALVNSNFNSNFNFNTRRMSKVATSESQSPDIYL